MDNEKRLKIYRESPEVIRDLYASLEIGEKIITYQEKFGLPVGDTRIQLIIGDTILGFYHTKDLPKLLQKEVGVSADVAQRMVSDLAEIFVPVLKREAELANPKLAEIKELHQTFQAAAGTGTTGSPEVPVNPTTVPAEPASVHDVAPMRTMAGDMNRVHGYGAYRQVGGDREETIVRAAPQDELLKSRQPLTGTPQVGE